MRNVKTGQRIVPLAYVLILFKGDQDIHQGLHGRLMVGRADVDLFVGLGQIVVENGTGIVVHADCEKMSLVNHSYSLPLSSLVVSVSLL